MCFEAHRSHIEVFVDDPGTRMISEHLIDGSIDILLHLSPQALAGRTAGRKELFLGHPLLFEAGSQLRLAPPLLAITLVLLCQIPRKAAVVLSCRGRDEIRDPHVDAHARRRWLRLKRNVLVKTERGPPDSTAAVQAVRVFIIFPHSTPFVLGATFHLDPQW